MALGDMFLKLDGISGEAKDDTHKDQIDISSFSWGTSNAGSGGSQGGSGTGKVSLSDIHISKVADKSSMNLFDYCCRGKHIPKGWLYVRKAGGDANAKDYETIELDEVFVSSWSQSASDGGGLPAESLSLNFSKIKFDYKMQNADGSLAAGSPKTWDVKLNKAS